MYLEFIVIFVSFSWPNRRQMLLEYVLESVSRKFWWGACKVSE